MIVHKLSKHGTGNTQWLEYSLPAAAGCIMIIASLLPWLRSPFGDSYSAWKLTIDPGWHIPTGVFNYGILCLYCACYCLFLAYANWKASRTGDAFYGCASAGFLCIMPIVLFSLQYLWLDFNMMSLLAQQKNQMLLVQGHFGYTAGPDFFPLQPFTIDISTIQGRFQLLIDQLQGGLLVPVACACLLFEYRSLNRSSGIRRRPMRIWMIGIASIILLLFLTMLTGAIGWLVCESVAGEAMAQGNYIGSLQWMDRATIFNPSLDRAIFYHIERGQVLHMEHPDQQSDDSRAYIALLFSEQYDYQDAYLQLQTIEQTDGISSWVKDDMSSMFEHLIEHVKPAQVQYIPLSLNATSVTQQDSAALPWLRLLFNNDTGNVYGQYILGRIDYDLHDYAQCNDRMVLALHLSSDADFQSSTYTYMALCEAGMGNYADERLLLLQAIQLDPAFRNNTARQELSGLR
jgi:hypothetical protein